MRTLAATAILCVGVVGAGLWVAFAGTAAPPAPPVVRLDQPAPPPAGAAGAGSVAAALDRFGSAAPKPMPPLSFLDGEGRRVDLDAFRDKLVLLNLWATWCGPCVKEMPALDNLQATLGGPGFQVVALSVDRGGKDQVEPFYRKTGVRSLDLYLDPASASMRALSLRGLPTTLLIDPEGRELGRVEGAVAWDSPEVVAFLRRQIGGQGGGGGGPARGHGGIERTGG